MVVKKVARNSFPTNFAFFLFKQLLQSFYIGVNALLGYLLVFSIEEMRENNEISEKSFDVIIKRYFLS